MKGKKYKTIYPSIAPKNTVGTCVDVVNAHLYALKIEFNNGECFWFLSRDLKEVPNV